MPLTCLALVVSLASTTPVSRDAFASASLAPRSVACEATAQAPAGKGKAGKGQAGKGQAGPAQPGKAQQGKAQQGKAQQGKAQQGKAQQGKWQGKGKVAAAKAAEAKAGQANAAQGNTQPAAAQQGSAQPAQPAPAADANAQAAGGAAASAQATEPQQATAAEPPKVPKEPKKLATIVPEHWLVLPPTDESGRRPFRPDAAFAKYLTSVGSPIPSVDEALTGETGTEQRWSARDAVDGVLKEDFGYAFTTIEAEQNGVWLADVRGVTSFFVNGSGFVADVYGYGLGGVPIALKQGPNNVFVRGRRSDLEFRLVEPAMPIQFAPSSAVLPDLVAGKDVEFDELASVVLLNASQDTGRQLELSITSPDGYFKQGKLPVPSFAPLGLRSATFSLVRATAPALNEKPTTHGIVLALAARGGNPFTRIELTVAVKDSAGARRATFESQIDGSVQSFAVLPPPNPNDLDTSLVLSLHGAGVDALGQVQSYSPKAGLWIVAPTNRRPYGFDWQDWGRDDAYEALAAALQLSHAPASRVYLTGHSMGGHGTWHLAATDPWRFSAIAPSAGWSSFDTYGGGRPRGELAWLWHAADACSRTEDLIANLRATPTFILHGEKDDNVPAKEAHELEAKLGEVGGHPVVHYEPEAGHWWDGDVATGVDCVDWPGIFELFRATPARVLGREFEFTCADPSVNARYGPFVLDQPLEYGAPLVLRGEWSASDSRLTVTTTNVRRLRVDFSKIESVGVRVKQFVIDGQTIDVWNDLRLAQIGDPTWFVRESETWAQDVSRGRVALAPVWRAYSDEGQPRYDGEKNSATSGPFKRAFDRRFALVYGSGGAPQENRALFEHARFDQETWWMRGNGVPALLSDVAFLADESRRDRPTRNVILYGNSRTNRAWNVVVGADAPIRVRPGAVELGAHRWTGDDLLALFVLPRADLRPDRPPYLRDPASDPSVLDEVPSWPLVAVVADTGLAGIRLGYQLSPFTSGVGYPDYAVCSSAVSRSGDGGVLAAGWFDPHWQLQPGGFLRPAASADSAAR
jgi:dienelactone hydrolase